MDVARFASLMVPVALVACAGAAPPGQVPVEGLASGAPAASGPASSSAGGTAHTLLVEAAGCWFGGLWSDALGIPKDRRRASAEQRCLKLVARLHGSEDRGKYDELRVLSAPAVDRIAAEMDRLAADDPEDRARKEPLVKLLRALAAAQRESNDAHSAADAVKQDLKNQSERENLTRDEVAAVKPLRAHAALAALLELDAGDLRAEARTMGLLCALDRLDVARALPRHLKVYAVGDALQLVFGVAPPAVPEDVTAKLKPGTWLGYLTEVARAAGHAVPAKATAPRERDPWAWGGVLEGFADKLRADAGKLAPGKDMARVASAIVARLDAEWAQIPTEAAEQKAMGEAEEKARRR